MRAKRSGRGGVRGLIGLLLLGWALVAAPAAATELPGLAWLPAATDADVDRAFNLAGEQGRPVLLYWGARWCPPCNRLKTTLFNRQDFIARARHFVAVHVDGDGRGAQRLGERFKVRGYPTLVVLRADGTEITRLPGEADASRVIALLQQGLADGRPARAVLADALAGRPLSPNEWRMLAFYGWDTDASQLVPESERAATLAQLSAACPASASESATRLMLTALAASDDGKGLKPDATLRRQVLALLADERATRAQMDLLVNSAAEIARALAPAEGAERRASDAAFDAALTRLQHDAGLSRADRMAALLSRVELARGDGADETLQPQLSAALLHQVRVQVANADREVDDADERQAVITEAAQLLARAGLWAESDALLKSSLARSPAPYYLMSQLAGNARRLGRNDEALRWAEQAWQHSDGPATRLQWGASYVGALVDLAPQDSARIEQAARQVFAEAARDPSAFHERSARSLERVGAKLAAWNRAGQHDAVIRRLADGPAGLAAVCARLPVGAAQRETCDGILKSALRPA